jgi:hypothetical protein
MDADLGAINNPVVQALCFYRPVLGRRRAEKCVVCTNPRPGRVLYQDRPDPPRAVPQQVAGELATFFNQLW